MKICHRHDQVIWFSSQKVTEKWLELNPGACCDTAKPAAAPALAPSLLYIQKSKLKALNKVKINALIYPTLCCCPAQGIWQTRLPEQWLCPWHAGDSREGWHLWGTGGQGPQKLPPGTAPATSCSKDTNLQWQLLHPCLPTATGTFYWTHSTLPTHWGFFPGICLDLRYMLIYYAESQTFSCSKKCHFTSPRVLPHYHFNKKQEQGFEAVPPINSTLLSLASQPTASVHSTRCLLDERKTKRWPPLMDHYAKHPNKAH